MKIVFLINSTKHIGGGDYAQFIFANELSKKGHEVVIFTGDKNFYFPELKKVKVFYRRTIPIFIKRIGLGVANRLWYKTYKKMVMEPFIRKFKPDVLVGYLRSSAITAQELGEKYHIKSANFVFENPQWMEEDLGEVWLDEWKGSTFRNSWLKTRIAYAKSDILIPNSILSGKKMKEWVPQANISEPAYPSVHFPPKKKVKRTIDVMFIGRLNKLKNVDDLIRALDPSWKTVFVGAKGDEEETLKELAKELNRDIEFKGPVSNEEKWKLLAKTKVLATATSHEGFGMPPLEAITYGCNVVCSDLPIFKEIYGKEAIYFKLHDVKDLHQKIKKALTLPEKKSKLHKKYTLENTTKTIETILLRLMK